MSQAVVLEPYNPAWVDKFNAEKQRVLQLLGDEIFDIEHVGLTAIPGMAAKPIIDIMVGVESLEASAVLISVLQKDGYCYFPYKKDIMHWFCKPSPEHREFHLYFVPRHSKAWRARLAFRDYLRTHADAAQDYLDLKKALAQKFHNDREAYTTAKASFVSEIVARAEQR